MPEELQVKVKIAAVPADGGLRRQMVRDLCQRAPAMKAAVTLALVLACARALTCYVA